MLLIALRVVHVLGGVFWAGALLFVVFFLEPAVRAAGPDGARVMQGLQKRHYLEVVPAVAVLTLLSGLFLDWRDFGRLYPGPGASGVELALGIGGLAALVALALGLAVLRPSALRMGALGAELAQSAPERREGLGAEMGRLRDRMRQSGRWVAALLGIAVVGMAIARYL
jgi:uncharacterized membrane protein